MIHKLLVKGLHFVRATELKISMRAKHRQSAAISKPRFIFKSLQLYRALTQKIIFLPWEIFQVAEVESHSGSFWGFGF